MIHQINISLHDKMEAVVGKEYKLGNIAGLSLSIEPAFFVGTILLWTALSGVGVWMLELPISQAIVGGLVAALLYWVSDIVHHLGHAYAARRTGYPMVGARLGKYLIFGTSLYPEDEEALPAEIHIRRALGGPIGSLASTAVTGIVALLFYPVGGVVWWIALFVCLANFFMFTIGPFLPLGFTDGSTILKWWGKR